MGTGKRALPANRNEDGYTKVRSFLMRTLSVVLVLIFAFPAMSVFATDVSSAEVTKVKRKYEIAVVFDNSGSMYKTKAWCQAKYAMEIFASMLNYDNGDKLSIFPMWEVTTDGKAVPQAPASVESTGSIQIKSQSDVEKISNMYTLNAGDTPITQVTNAYNYLSQITDKTVTDKWLIVLTDGAFTDSEGENMESSLVREQLVSRAANGIKVQYLGFGSAVSIKDDVSKGFYTKTSNASTLRKDLVDICNAIFQRSKLEKKYLNGQNLRLDVSMRKLIVFVQGKNAEIVSLKQKNGGKQISKITDSGKIKFSKLGAADYSGAPYDDSLYGQVVTFNACSVGDYILEYKGATNIEIFYEPDVDINIVMKKDGRVVDPKNEKLYPGEYSFEYSVIDRESKKDVTSSPLVDVQNLDCAIEVKNGGKTEKISDYKSGTPISLEGNDELFFDINGTYLTEYTITTKDNREGFTFDIEPFPEVPEFEIGIDVIQEDNWYTLKERDSWKPIKVGFSVGDQPLTDEQTAKVASEISIEPELPFTYEILPGESAIAVYIAKDENGNDTEPAPESGSYEIEVEAFYTDENGQVSNDDSEDAKFKIQKYQAWVIKLIALAIIAGLLLLAFIISRIPAYPKKVAIQKKVGENNWMPKNGKKLKVKNSISARIDNVVVFSGKTSKSAPLSRRSKQSSSFTVKVSQIMSGVDSMKIGNKAVSSGKNVEVTINNGTLIKAEKDGQTKVYRIIINSKR